jgi:hypothetical protein
LRQIHLHQHLHYLADIRCIIQAIYGPIRYQSILSSTRSTVDIEQSESLVSRMRSDPGTLCPRIAGPGSKWDGSRWKVRSVSAEYICYIPASKCPCFLRPRICLSIMGLVQGPIRWTSLPSVQRISDPPSSARHRPVPARMILFVSCYHVITLLSPSFHENITINHAIKRLSGINIKG